MYAATHIGHLGINARIVVGMIHFVVNSARRVVDLAGWCGTVLQQM
jgi:hypothetical protein